MEQRQKEMQIIAGLGDFIVSLQKSLDEIDPRWRELDGLIIPGSHEPSLVEEKIAAIKEARETGRPFLGICLGHQLAAIEYARSILDIKDATSEEFGVPGTFVVKKLPKLNVGIHEVNGRMESFWNNYEVAIETKYPKNFFTCQYHPEYQSSKDSPHQLLVEFLSACRNHKK